MPPRFPLIVVLPKGYVLPPCPSPAYLHDDDARSSFSSSGASWPASRCLESPPLENVISHGSRSTMSPFSTNANLCRLLIRPSGESSRAGMRYHSLIAGRTEFGAESRFGRCSLKAWLRMRSTRTLGRARAPANCGCTFSRLRNVAPGYPTKRHRVVAPCPGCSGPICTNAPGCVGPRRLWSHLPSARPGCGHPDLLDRCLQLVPS